MKLPCVCHATCVAQVVLPCYCHGVAMRLPSYVVCASCGTNPIFSASLMAGCDSPMWLVKWAVSHFEPPGALPPWLCHTTAFHHLRGCATCSDRAVPGCRIGGWRPLVFQVSLHKAGRVLGRVPLLQAWGRGLARFRGGVCIGYCVVLCRRHDRDTAMVLHRSPPCEKRRYGVQFPCSRPTGGDLGGRVFVRGAPMSLEFRSHEAHWSHDSGFRSGCRAGG